MAEASSNTSNMQGTPYIPTPGGSEVKPQVTSEAPKTVDVTSTGETAVVTKPVETTEKKEGFDSNNYNHLSDRYIREFMASWYNKQPVYKIDERSGDGVCLTNILTSKPEDLTLAFGDNIRQNMKDKEEHTAQTEEKRIKLEQQETFLASNNETNSPIYRYMTSPLGLLQIEINAEGKDIGVPQLVS